MRAAAVLTVVLVTALLAGGTPAAGATGAAAPPAVVAPDDPAAPAVVGSDDPADPAAPAGRTATVTLLTGDQVSVATAPGGERSVTIRPAPRAREVTFTRAAVGDAVYVIPSDVAGLVPDVLDRDLFDVGLLADAGYDDAARGTTPVILRSAQGPGGTRPLDVSPYGITPERTLTSLDAVSAELTPHTAGRLLDALRAGGSPVGQVLLDAPVQKLDEESAGQIGAPAAWDGGWTGEGVTVAVLDTGLDAAHPDLTGLVTGSRDFTGKGAVTDGSGHGTHVASILAGSGAASGGAHRGIAPGADLLVGKVLDDTGHGEQSWTIDAMEWAAAQGADVVNLSLGSEPTDGTDPVAAAVDELTATHDTLFVAAAGNAGDPGSIGSPGSATSALTVGAVDDDDVTAPFSSQGPRAGDGAIKPDVAAPGVEILAARAAGTSPGLPAGDLYLAGSGTSMAAPHVAGAAAVLRGAHPEWTAGQVKARLMGSAEAARGATVWEQGAGRVWIPGALELPVVAEPASVSFGSLEHPGQTAPSSRTLAYVNPTDRDVTLALGAELTGPDGDVVRDGLTLGARQLTVPAGGRAATEVSVDTSAGPIGRYSGTVTASVKGQGNREVRTPVGYEKKPEVFDVTIRPLGRDGEPLTGTASLALLDVRDLRRHQELLQLDGERTVRLEGGTYGLLGGITETGADGAPVAVTGVSEPEFVVDRDLVVEVSAEGAMPVSVTTPLPSELVRATLDYQRWDASGSALDMTVGGDAPLYATPTDPVSTGWFDLVGSFVLTEPVAAGESAADADYTYDLAFQQSPVTDVSFEAREADLARVEAGYAAGPRGVVPNAGWAGLAPGHFVAWSTLDPVATPSTRTAYVTGGDFSWSKSVWYTELIDGGAGGIVNHGSYEAPFRKFAAGSSTPAVYGGGAHSVSATATTSRDGLEVTATGWTDGDGHLFQVPQWASAGFDQRLRLWREDDLLTDVPQGRAVVPVPNGRRAMRLAYDGDRRSPWPTAPGVSAEWEFPAQPPSGDRETRLPLLQVAYDVAGLGLDGTAPGRTTVTVTAVAPDGGRRAAAEAATLWWSPDDGVTWHEAATTGTGDGVFSATVDAPPGTRRVSLRVEAESPDGVVRETTVGAYTIG
ncbi:S8 family serine peptidase [Myceligenerans crystallogenes]|uniref:S8 family serine peptidase n=1 Tax=Myceligenerans crystallogenes TaxID=316335 RepID=A0ABP4ZRK5_9MICO